MACKIIIYQVLPRLFGNRHKKLVKGGSLKQNGCGKFSAFTMKRLADIKSLGATHIWLTGVLEHATLTDYSKYNMPADNPETVKGVAGSPYAVRDYYDVDPDLADNVERRLEEFDSLISRVHRSGMKVIIDFVPNHVARNYHSDKAPAGVGDFGVGDDNSLEFSPANNFYYIQNHHPFCSPKANKSASHYLEYPAKATGNDCFSSSPGEFDWYDTVKLNYGVDIMGGKAAHFDPMPDTWKRMRNILEYWCGRGVDGFRCDMSEMVPVEFWHWAIASIKEQYPDVIFIAEIYNPSVYSSYAFYGGFDYLYDKVGLYDKLRNVVCRRSPASELSQCWQSLSSDMLPRMLNFIENHDEQRVASDFYAGNAIKGRAPMIVASLMGSNPVMIYAGQEFGERGMDAEGYSGLDGRTTIYDYWSPSTLRKALFEQEELSQDNLELRNFYARLLHGVCRRKAITRGKMFDLTYCNLDRYAEYPTDRIFTFLRGGGSDGLMLIAANFSDTPVRASVRIPAHAFDYMQIERGKYRRKELLGEMEKSKRNAADIDTLMPECMVRINVPANGGSVILFDKI